MVAKLIDTKRKKTREPGQILYLSKRGRVYRLRRMHEADCELLIEMFLKLSNETLQKRFMRPYLKINETIAREYVSSFWSGRTEKQYMLLATVREDNREQAIAVAELIHSGNPADPAEVALMVRDDYQREGVGTNLIQEIIEEAKNRGITHWKADISASNLGIRKLAQKSGKPYTSITSYGETQLFGTF